MSLTRNRAGTRTLLAFAGVLLCRPGLATDGRDAIREAWQNRQSQVGSLHFEWTQEMRRRSPAAPTPLGEQGDAGGGSEKQLQVLIPQQCSFRLDGDKIDYRCETPDGLAHQMPIVYRSSFDGSTSRRFGDAPESEVQAGSGFVESAPHAFDTNRIELRPLILTYRPLHPTIGRIDLGEHRVLDQRRPIGSHSCLIVEESHERPVKKSYWVDPDRDYIVLRYVSSYKGREGLRQDIEYEHDADHGWIPKRWKLLVTDDEGLPRQTTEAVVTHYTLNAPIPAEEFTFAFPDGTLVADKSDGEAKDHWVGGKLSPRTSSHRLIWLLGIGAILLAIIVYVRRTRQHST